MPITTKGEHYVQEVERDRPAPDAHDRQTNLSQAERDDRRERAARREVRPGPPGLCRARSPRAVRSSPAAQVRRAGTERARSGLPVQGSQRERRAGSEAELQPSHKRDRAADRPHRPEKRQEAEDEGLGLRGGHRVLARSDLSGDEHVSRRGGRDRGPLGKRAPGQEAPAPRGYQPALVLLAPRSELGQRRRLQAVQHQEERGADHHPPARRQQRLPVRRQPGVLLQPRRRGQGPAVGFRRGRLHQHLPLQQRRARRQPLVPRPRPGHHPPQRLRGAGGLLLRARRVRYGLAG